MTVILAITTIMRIGVRRRTILITITILVETTIRIVVAITVIVSIKVRKNKHNDGTRNVLYGVLRV